jgi:hypothetical protein
MSRTISVTNAATIVRLTHLGSMGTHILSEAESPFALPNCTRNTCADFVALRWPIGESFDMLGRQHPVPAAFLLRLSRSRRRWRRGNTHILGKTAHTALPEYPITWLKLLYASANRFNPFRYVSACVGAADIRRSPSELHTGRIYVEMESNGIPLLFIEGNSRTFGATSVVGRPGGSAQEVQLVCLHDAVQGRLHQIPGAASSLCR